MGFAPFQPVARRRSDAVRDHVAALLPLTVLLLLPAALAPLSLWALAAPALALAVVLGYGVSIALALQPPRTERRPLALRLVVAWLHVAQPFARMFGRLRGHAAEAADEPSPAWTGDRAEWLYELQRELSTGHCKVRPGKPYESFDLAVSVGPLVSCRLRTAVAWRWLPRQRTDLRPRPTALLLLLIGGLLLPLEPIASGVVCGCLAVSVVVESVLVRRRVARALEATTSAVHIEDA